MAWLPNVSLNFFFKYEKCNRELRSEEFAETINVSQKRAKFADLYLQETWIKLKSVQAIFSLLSPHEVATALYTDGRLRSNSKRRFETTVGLISIFRASDHH